MKPERRQWLQYCHDKDSIVLGLAGSNWKEQEQLVILLLLLLTGTRKISAATGYGF